ncbi:MAG: EAL domain-containing protein [Dehalococcoidia bacterium]
MRGRIIAAFGLLVIILMGVAAGSAWQVREHQADTAAMEEHADTAVVLQNGLINAEAAASGLQRYVMIGGETLVAGDEELLPRIRSDMAEAEESLAQAIAHAEALGEREQAARFYQISAEADSLVAGVEMIIALQQSGDTQAAASGLEVAVLPFREFEEKLETAAEVELQKVSALRSQADRTGGLALWLLIISGATGAALGLAISVIVARSIIKPLSSLEATATAVSEGDLEARAEASGPRELANLGAALNQMTESLLDASKRRELEQALRQSEERLHTVVDSTPIVMFALDRQGVFTLSEGKGLDALGLKPGQIVGQSIFDVYREAPQILENVRRALAGETFKSLVEVAGLVFESWYSPLCDESGEITGVIGVATDISERRRAEQALQVSETKFRTLADTVAAATFIYQGTRLRYVNPATEALTGYTRDELLTMKFWDVIHPDFRQLVKERGLARQRGEDVPGQYETKVQTKGGEERWVEFTLGVIEFEGNPAVLGTGFDITERKRAEDTIKHLAYHDALTNLPNRTLLQDRLTVALAQAHRSKRMLAVMFLDLDRFKVVNDTVGHEGGDGLLRSVAERLASLMREGDTVARMGGDEFAILSPEIASVEDAPEVAERILDGLRKPWVVQGQEFHVTTSIGVALYPSDGDDAETLLRNADTAMYRAKEHGRDNYQLYTPAMNARIAERLAVESSLRHSLERGEFVVHYQPQVDLRSGQVVGTEALVRWQHPERGLVAPAEFIPVAEDTGLIVPLGEWVLRTACAQNKAWQEEGIPPLRVAVNLSARQFQQRNLIDMVAQVLEETGLDPHRLQLEITEGVAMQDTDFTIDVLQGLRAMGVQIAMDDFGTGYSSLSYLKRLPFKTVKIDRSFVRDLTVDLNDAAIAAAIIAMAHNLKLNVIAEGVETVEQLALLKRQGCDEMQGYLFSRPGPPDVIGELLRKGGEWSRSKIAIDSPRTRSAAGAAKAR